MNDIFKKEYKINIFNVDSEKRRPMRISSAQSEIYGINHLLENSIIHYNYWNFGELLYNTISLIDEYHVFERR